MNLSTNKMCIAKNTAEMITKRSPIFKGAFFSIHIKNIPTSARTTATQPFQFTLLPKNKPKIGANTTYNVVKKPDAPTDVYLIPYCCKVLARVIVKPQSKPLNKTVLISPLFFPVF